jgi:uncharacterized protein YeeX (DUF496 family)
MMAFFQKKTLNFFKRHAKESQNHETIESLCDNIKEQIKDLCEMIESDYLQRINNYITKEQLNNRAGK